MSIVTLSWEEFLQEATKFQKISERLDDTWTLYKKVLFIKFNKKMKIQL